MEIIDSIFIDKPEYRFSKKFKTKEIFFAFKIDSELKETAYRTGMFTKISPLFRYLNKKYNEDLTKFKLVFYENQQDKRKYFIIKNEAVTEWWINLDEYKKACKPIKESTKDPSFIKQFSKKRTEISDEIPDYFFNDKPMNILVQKFNENNYKIYDEIFKSIDALPKKEKETVLSLFQRSKLGAEAFDKIKNLAPESPEVQLKLFLKVADKLPNKDLTELFNFLIDSKSSNKVIKEILKYIENKPVRYKLLIDWVKSLSNEKQMKLFEDIPEAIKIYSRYKLLKKSRDEFNKKILAHLASKNQNEKDIHKFLIKNWWLLGLQYFDQRILSDYTQEGERTSETRISNTGLAADFIIERLDGEEDRCFLVEIEEANDKIFNQNGTLSMKVFDGINQAIRYVIETRLKGKYSKGIAIIGSVLGMNLTDEQKHRLSLLKESFHNIEVLTYDDLLKTADSTIKFLEEYIKIK